MIDIKAVTKRAMQKRIKTSRHANVYPELYEKLLLAAYGDAFKGDERAGKWIVQELAIREKEAAKREYRAMKSKPFMKELRKQPCYICGGKAGQIDHVIPISKGGENTLENMKPVCRPCNMEKSDKTEDTEIGTVKRGKS